MNKKIKKIIIPLILLIIMQNETFAQKGKIIIDKETFSFNNNKNNILSNFDVENNKEENEELKEKITDLTKKTTYLLLGEPNAENESSENYYKRHRDFLQLRYNPEVPKDENSSIGLDENSQEYKDDILSGISVPGMFSKLNELNIKYSNYGNITISKLDDTRVLGAITLTNIIMKDKNNSRNYNNVQTNLTIYYYFKELNNEYKLLYLYGETEEDIESYIENSNEQAGKLLKEKDYNSNLKDIYDFGKANEITDNTLLKIYNENKNNIVFLNSVYNTGMALSANGFFIKDGLVMTTYNYVENSLIKAQNIIVNDNDGNTYELDGIVTMNAENDIAILKVKNKRNNYVKIADKKIEKEDAVITLNSKIGIGLNTSKGIITAIDDNIQVSIPSTESMQGSPLFDTDGNLIGMMNSKSINTSLSYATNMNVIKEYYNKFDKKVYEEIKAVSFNELKEKYYIKYNEEKLINNIPEDKLKEFNNVEDINEKMTLKLIKGSYKDGIISLRYKNDILNYMDTMQFASEYEEYLISKGYTKTKISNSKNIYENKKYKIVIMKEFDYLIIVMVKL